MHLGIQLNALRGSVLAIFCSLYNCNVVIFVSKSMLVHQVLGGGTVLYISASRLLITSHLQGCRVGEASHPGPTTTQQGSPIYDWGSAEAALGLVIFTRVSLRTKKGEIDTRGAVAIDCHPKSVELACSNELQVNDLQSSPERHVLASG